MTNVVESLTSFQKGSARCSLAQGTRISLRNAQLLVSSGVTSLDTFLGGGIPVGTICCIEEDISGIFSELIFKHFLAEGVLNGHNIFLASHDAEAHNLVEDLPCPVADEESSLKGDVGNDQMKIAWRYEKLSCNELPYSQSKFGHIYNTSQVMDSDRLKSANIKYWKRSKYNTNVTQLSLTDPYLDLLNSIRREIEVIGCKIDSTNDKKNVIRVALYSISSPPWFEQLDSNAMDSQFLLFIYFLKALLRSSYAVCMLTVPAHLFRETSTLTRLRNVVDIGVQLEAFADSEEEINEVYREYCGLFRFSKLFAINTVMPHLSESLDLAFKLRRKRLIIETPRRPSSLPPIQLMQIKPSNRFLTDLWVILPNGCGKETEDLTHKLLNRARKKLCLMPELLERSDKDNIKKLGCRGTLPQQSEDKKKGLSCSDLDF